MSARKGALQRAQEVLDKGFYGVPSAHRIDATSAALVVAVGKALGDEQRAKLDALPVRRAAEICWHLQSRTKGAA